MTDEQAFVREQHGRPGDLAGSGGGGAPGHLPRLRLPVTPPEENGPMAAIAHPSSVDCLSFPGSPAPAPARPQLRLVAGGCARRATDHALVYRRRRLVVLLLAALLLVAVTAAARAVVSGLG